MSAGKGAAAPMTVPASPPAKLRSTRACNFERKRAPPRRLSISRTWRAMIRTMPVTSPPDDERHWRPLLGGGEAGAARQADRRPSLRNALDPGEKPPRPIAAVACNPYVGHGSARQISFAYSEIVRSLENFPEAAILRMTLCAQSSGLR